VARAGGGGGAAAVPQRMMVWWAWGPAPARGYWWSMHTPQWALCPTLLALQTWGAVETPRRLSVVGTTAEADMGVTVIGADGRGRRTVELLALRAMAQLVVMALTTVVESVEMVPAASGGVAASTWLAYRPAGHCWLQPRRAVQPSWLV
jgi:hypothetical protein